jgi:hypothetical protein
MYILYYQAETEPKPMHTNKSHSLLTHLLCLQNANDITIATTCNVAACLGRAGPTRLSQIFPHRQRLHHNMADASSSHSTAPAPNPDTGVEVDGAGIITPCVFDKESSVLMTNSSLTCARVCAYRLGLCFR